MFASSKRHWATFLAVGLPLLVGGCAGSGPANPYAESAPPGAGATRVDALTLADRLKAEGNTSSAASMYQQAHQANPGDVRPMLGLGESYLAMGANAEAAEAFGAALAVQPNNLDALRGLGHARILLGQPEFALTQYQLAVQLAPKDVRALNGLGVARDMAGDHKAAQQSYRSVLAIDPNNQSAKNNMALSLALSGDNEGAIKMLEDISKSSGASTVNRQNLALVYGVSGQMGEAEKVGRADLPDDVVRRNIAAMNASSDPTARQDLLKHSLGVELKGLQYTPAAQPTMPLTNLAQASAVDQPVYLSDSNAGTLPLITTGKSQQATSASAPQDVVLKPSTGDDWSDEWDEELVGASDADTKAPPSLTASAVEPLPAAPTVAEPKAPAASPFLSSTDAATNGSAKPTPAQTTAAAATAGNGAASVVQMAAVAPVKAEPTVAAAADQPMTAKTVQAESVAPAAVTAKAETETMTVTAKSVSGAKVYTVQIASYRSESEAVTGWQTLTAEQSDLLAGLPHSVNKTDLGAEKGVFYRLQAGSFGSKDDARSLCTGLKSRAIDCMVVESAAAQPPAPEKTQQSMLSPDQSFVVGAR